MKELITKDILKAYGFQLVKEKSKNKISVFSKNKIDIVITDDGSVYYSNMGFDYRLRDVYDLKKLYKELRRDDLIKE